MHKAGTVFHGGIRFPRFLTFVLLALFVAAPQARGRFQTAAAGCRSTGLHPSEDLSELPPLRSVVAGQEYHCPRTRSLRGSLPKLLLDGWGRSSPSWAVFIQKICTGGLRASSASLFHFWLVRLMSCQSLDMYFSSCTRRTENVPSMHRPRERLFYKVV